MAWKSRASELTQVTANRKQLVTVTVTAKVTVTVTVAVTVSCRHSEQCPTWQTIPARTGNYNWRATNQLGKPGREEQSIVVLALHQTRPIHTLINKRKSAFQVMEREHGE